MTRLTAIHPVLPTKAVKPAIDFYVGRLGFQLAGTDRADDPRYAVIRRDAIEAHLQWHSAEEWARDGVDRLMLRIAVDDPASLFAEYADKGVFHDRTALRKTGWGTEEFAFYDLDGNGLTFYRDLDEGGP